MPCRRFHADGAGCCCRDPPEGFARGDTEPKARQGKTITCCPRLKSSGRCVKPPASQTVSAHCRRNLGHRLARWTVRYAWSPARDRGSRLPSCGVPRQSGAVPGAGARMSSIRSRARSQVREAPVRALSAELLPVAPAGRGSRAGEPAGASDRPWASTRRETRQPVDREDRERHRARQDGLGSSDLPGRNSRHAPPQA